MPCAGEGRVCVAGVAALTATRNAIASVCLGRHNLAMITLPYLHAGAHGEWLSIFHALRH